MLSISGLDFFKLPRTRAWYSALLVNVTATVGLIAYVFSAISYNRTVDPDSQSMHYIIPVGSVGIFLFMASIAWLSSTLCHGIQIYRGVHSLFLRMNSIYTFFVALLYSMMSFMEYRQPIVYLDTITTYGIVCMVPLLIMVILKIYIGFRLIKRRLARLGGAVLVFWSLFVIAGATVIIRGVAHPHDVFNIPVTAVVAATMLAGVNMLFRYSATSLLLAYYPREYEKDLEHYNKKH